MKKNGKYTKIGTRNMANIVRQKAENERAGLECENSQTISMKHENKTDGQRMKMTLRKRQDGRIR